MKRLRKNTVEEKEEFDALFLADWHIRGNNPEGRDEKEFLSAQEYKKDFIFSIAEKYKVPIISAGDLGEKSQWSDTLLEKFISIKKKYPSVVLYTVLGQHDLPGHNLERYRESGCGVLSAAGEIRILDEYPVLINSKFWCVGFSFGVGLKKMEKRESLLPFMAVTHQMVIKDKLWEEQKNASKAKKLLKTYPTFDVILSGDNHQSFLVEKDDGQLLINPGSVMRTTTAQKKHNPVIFLWNSSTGDIKKVYIPIDGSDDVFLDNFVEKKIENDFGDFIQLLNNNSNKSDEDKDSRFENVFEKEIQNIFFRRGTKKPVRDFINDVKERITETS